MKSRRSISTALAIAIVCSLVPGAFSKADAADTSAGTKTDLAGVSLVTLHSRRGELGPEAELELINATDHPLYFHGGVSAPDYSQHCLEDGKWGDDNMGRCGTGEEPHAPPILAPGQHIRFTAHLCREAEATQITVDLAVRPGERDEVFVSASIPMPPRTDSDPLPNYDDFEATREAFRHLRERGALGALGKTWKLEAPHVGKFRVTSVEATECVPAGDYVVVQYAYIDQPAEGPNSIVYELPISRKLRWVGDLSAMSMDEAIALFRKGTLCD
jgi:hypothetical protein